MTASRLADVPQAPPDPILGVSEAFRADTHPDRLNLGVGAYRTEELKPYVLDVVREAEARLVAAAPDKEYLPIEGYGPFNKATARLLLGDASPALADGRVATIQCLSGTGSLRIGADFIAKFLPGTKVYVSDPTWGNHHNIFGDAGLQTLKYRYFDAATIGLDAAGMLEDLEAAPDGSVVVLHGEWFCGWIGSGGGGGVGTLKQSSCSSPSAAAHLSTPPFSRKIALRDRP